MAQRKTPAGGETDNVIPLDSALSKRQKAEEAEMKVGVAEFEVGRVKKNVEKSGEQLARFQRWIEYISRQVATDRETFKTSAVVLENAGIEVDYSGMEKIQRELQERSGKIQKDLAELGVSLGGQPAAVETPADKPAPAMEAIEKKQPAKFSFDKARGVLIFPDGVELDASSMKGHCIFNDEGPKGALRDFIIGDIDLKDKSRALIEPAGGGRVNLSVREGFGKNETEKKFFNLSGEQAKAKLAEFFKTLKTVEASTPVEEIPAKASFTPVVEAPRSGPVKEPKEFALWRQSADLASEPVEETVTKKEVGTIKPEQVDVVLEQLAKEAEELNRRRQDRLKRKQKPRLEEKTEVEKELADLKKIGEAKSVEPHPEVKAALEELGAVETEAKKKREVIAAAPAVEAETELTENDIEEIKMPPPVPKSKIYAGERTQWGKIEGTGEALKEAQEPAVEEQAARYRAEWEAEEKAAEKKNTLHFLEAQLEAKRRDLSVALAQKEKSGGWLGRVNEFFGSKAKQEAEAQYEKAWQGYQYYQEKIISESAKRAEDLRNYLDGESKQLRRSIGEVYKGKENFAVRAWKKLGDLNLYNYLEHERAKVEGKNSAEESVGAWDKFWYKRAMELEQSGAWAKIGAKALNARLGISIGLLGVGLWDVLPSLATSGVYFAGRTGFAGAGGAFGGRAVADGIQNFTQKWLGKRGEVFKSKEEATAYWQEKLGVVAETTDDANEALDATVGDEKKRQKCLEKLNKELGKAEKVLSSLNSLEPEKRLENIQSRLAAIEAYAYVNGFDVEKDENYNRLINFRDQTVRDFMTERAADFGQAPVIRPDDLFDVESYLNLRKKEIDQLAKKIGTEKSVRWGKRIFSVTVGAAAGSLAYLGMMRRAAAAAAEAAGHYTKVAEYVPTPHAVHPVEAAVEAPKVSVGAPAEISDWQKAGLSQEAIERVNGLNASEAAATSKVFDMAHNQPELAGILNRAVESGHKPSEILRSISVTSERGFNSVEGLLQKQLKLNPEAFGYHSESGLSVEKWAGRQAHLLAERQGLADTVLAKSDRFVILDENGKVEIIKGAVEKSAKAAGKAGETAELYQTYRMSLDDAHKYLDLKQKYLDLMKEGNPVEAKKFLSEAEKFLSPYAKFLTKAERAYADNLLNQGKTEAAVDFMNRIKTHGPLLETLSGKQYRGPSLSDVSSVK